MQALLTSSQIISGPAVCSRRSTVTVQRPATLRVQALFTKQKSGKTGYDKGAKEVDPAQPAFTRRRELFVGRLAMVGFASALIGEVATGKGVIGQIAQELSVPPIVAEVGLYATVAYGLLGALRPGSPTFSESNQKDVKKLGKGPLQNPKIRPTDAAKFAGTSTGPGFTKQNEVIVGRTAQIGFAAAVIGEKVTGKGPLTQFGLETGIPLGTASIGLVIFISFFLFAALFEGNYGDKGIDDDTAY